MKFCIINHVVHIKYSEGYFAYSPYVREMNLWVSNFNEVEIVAPLANKGVTKIDLSYEHDKLIMTPIAEFDVTSFRNALQTIVKLPKLCYTIYQAMKRADHIHLRCPGNVGLLGSMVQILFPNKPKTAKYAGNWDPSAKQPMSYKIQKWILNNTFLTKNMQVLVYGKWPKASKNVVPFFTASYTQEDAIQSQSLPIKKLPEPQNAIQFLFVGTLSIGKRPLYALQLFNQLIHSGLSANLSIYGEGPERANLEAYINQHQLQSVVTLHGNQDAHVLKQAYQSAHFLVLASQSEGWPKVVAEAMFWGCVPLSTPVSCVAQMMGHGERGLILSLDINADVDKVTSIVNIQESYETMSILAKTWSTDYTLEKFEEAVKKLL